MKVKVLGNMGKMHTFTQSERLAKRREEVDYVTGQEEDQFNWTDGVTRNVERSAESGTE